ncbi:hypothetical protein [Nostoc sp.]|uniref:hypothetical protein n=1 Tax=Nostoc sp. TaxID=1180 RepID=UPI002FF6EDBC
MCVSPSPKGETRKGEATGVAESGISLLYSALLTWNGLNHSYPLTELFCPMPHTSLREAVLRHTSTGIPSSGLVPSEAEVSRDAQYKSVQVPKFDYSG